MAGNINRVMLTGNLTRDPDTRQTASGMPILTFGVASNERRKNKQTGEWEDYPNFIDCTVMGNYANSLSQNLRKGMKVAIEGRLRYSSWQGKDGQKRSKLEVIADEVEYSKPQQQPIQNNYHAAQGYQAPQPAPQPYQAPQPAPQPMSMEQQAMQMQYQQMYAQDDIPFD